MKEFKDYTISDFTERVKMPETNLVGKRVVVTSFGVTPSSLANVHPSVTLILRKNNSIQTT
ncbi:MAG: hypothetical protein KBT34_05100 [Prevotella sp.]|nr:hypothetical protein [Candidatus Prevotella equi]